MTVALIFGVFYLRTKFFAHTLVLGFLPHPTRTVSAFRFQSLDYRLDDFSVFVKPYFHFSLNFPHKYAVAQTITTTKEVVNAGIFLIGIVAHTADIKNIIDKIVCNLSPDFSFFFDTKTEIESAIPTKATRPNRTHTNAFPYAFRG